METRNKSALPSPGAMRDAIMQIFETRFLRVIIRGDKT